MSLGFTPIVLLSAMAFGALRLLGGCDGPFRWLHHATRRSERSVNRSVSLPKQSDPSNR
jgi:hypothetical protein